MRTIPRFTLIFAVAAVSVALAQDGWISLFNGKDFTDWKIGGNQAWCQIIHHPLVAHGRVPHSLDDGPVQNHDLKNFELMLEFKTAPHSNGIYHVHTEFPPRGL